MRKRSEVPQSSRLPVWHPEFRYTESRNIYFKKLQELRGRVFSDHETESLRGKWREAFPERFRSPRTELHIEVGCNAGHVIVEWARRHPERAYVGLDWKYKPIFRAAEKARKHGLENIVFFRAHAERLGFMFGEWELDRVSVFFPDPWAKKKQLKNRWINPERMRDLHRILKPGGFLHIKTDHRGYFDWMEESVAQTSSLWEIVERTTDLHALNPAPFKLEIPDVTLFEKLFIRDGIPINSLRLKARK